MLDNQPSPSEYSCCSSEQALSVIDQASGEYWTTSSAEAESQPYATLHTMGTLACGLANKCGQIYNMSHYFLEEKQNFDPNITVTSIGTESPDHEAKIQIFNQLKLFRIFKLWKNNCFTLNHALQIQKQQQKQCQNLRTKFVYFMEWKTTTIKQKRAQEYYRKKIYRTFFMTCSQLLQVRLKLLYVEEILKVSRFPSFLAKLTQQRDQNREKQKGYYRKIGLKRLIKRLKQLKVSKDVLRLSTLAHQYSLKRKCWQIFAKK